MWDRGIYSGQNPEFKPTPQIELQFAPCFSLVGWIFREVYLPPNSDEISLFYYLNQVFCGKEH